jgi:hypothetical protein
VIEYSNIDPAEVASLCQRIGISGWQIT